MDARACRRRLAILWLSSGALLFLILVGQHLADVYGSRVGEAWDWFGARVLPLLSLMVGALSAQAFAKERRNQYVEPIAFWVSVGLSCVYLLVAFSTLLMQKAVPSRTPLEVLSESAIYLGPLQGLVGLSLGAFFAMSQGEK